jgi:hypothetical protein
MKYSDSSKVMPTAANTTAKLVVAAPHPCLTGNLGGQSGVGQTGAGEYGSFWPLTRVFSPSIVEIPVWINSEDRLWRQDSWEDR